MAIDVICRRPLHIITKRSNLTLNEHYKFINTPLPYAYNALEPFIDEKTMHLHHDKHLQTYIDNLNTILKDYPQYQNLSLVQLIMNAQCLPESIRIPIINNAGGVFNHQFYFANLIKGEGKVPAGMLAEYLDRTFGSFQEFKDKFKAAALSVFGSGYAWLVVDYQGVLRIVTTPNQNTPIPQNMCPVLNVDVWEHAYYLKHYNVRANYIDDWFQVVNWERANQNYLNCFSW